MVTTAEDYAEISAGVGYCFGLIEGITSLARTFQAVVLLGKVQGEQIFCLPENGTNLQLLRVIVKHLEGNPKILHKSDSYLAIMAFKEAFPCQR